MIFTLGQRCADLRDDAFDLLACAGRRIDVRTAQLRAQQMLTAEDVQRQVAVVVVVAVKEATFLMPVQRIIGGIQIQDDLARAARGAPRETAPPISRSIASLSGAIL